ncbi:MAG: hypothetical protein Q8L20_06400 [Gammaproteobacteria bacterium]|uniref:sensor histidine kinase n=1 Tax=Brevundimonas sp. TaxID=1871086 RepID=UPI002730455B|nr:ATP-binding protein [Brevundimonas sp.]MDP1912735.1 hypothetical protein [Brevundimonas sp.]MDP2140425.1 hypothetical protein [Gammaproteobacteria bacterium]MDP2349464.1 hypothetical protein [Gammaproteobacteria bacterium]
MTTVDLYPYLIIVGSSILLAAAWLLHRARAQTQRSQALVQLNEGVRFDLLDFLRQCWPELSAGGFSGLEWKLDWFGASVTGSQGAVAEGVLHKSFAVREIALDIRLYHKTRGWEQRYFSQVLADKFFLLLHMDIWIKLGTVSGAFDQTAKMTVFLQHDMKNLLQLVSLAADQLENQVPGQEARLLESLQTTIPAVRDRARHMLKALISDQNMGQPVAVSMAPTLRDTATMYELDIKIVGEATVMVPKESLHSILENLLGNYSWQSRQKSSNPTNLQVEIVNEADAVIVRLMDINGKPCLWPERLFEPFWSERGSGRGIGLYQSRQLANAAGGSLEVNALSDRPLQFVLSLPSANGVSGM